jgi:hypothetical protein
VIAARKGFRDTPDNDKRKNGIQRWLNVLDAFFGQRHSIQLKSASKAGSLATGFYKSPKSLYV